MKRLSILQVLSVFTFASATSFAVPPSLDQKIAFVQAWGEEALWHIEKDVSPLSHSFKSPETSPDKPRRNRNQFSDTRIPHPGDLDLVRLGADIKDYFDCKKCANMAPKAYESLLKYLQKQKKFDHSWVNSTPYKDEKKYPKIPD